MLLEWTDHRPDSVIIDVIRLKRMFELPPDFKWLAPWSALSNDADPDAIAGGQVQAEIESGQTIAGGLVAELRREMPPDHRLAECELRVIGRCDADHNEFLYVTDDPSAPIACVHLTWKAESNANWPHADVYANLDDWITQMTRENVGLAEMTRKNGG